MRTLSVALTLSALLVGFALWILTASGELLGAGEVAQRQRSAGGVYGTALNRNTYQYKIALVKVSHPEVVAFGSSRVMQFRARYFARPFVNLGGAVNSPYELPIAVADVLQTGVPRVAVVGVDHWWFNKRLPLATKFPQHAIAGDELDSNKLFEPYRLVRDGRLKPGHLGRILSSPPNMLGLQAQIFGDGFGPDGSYYYSSLLGGTKPNEDRNFTLMLDRIERDHSIFSKFGDFDDDAFGSLASGVSLLKAAGVTVITFLPPLSPKVLRALRQRDGKLDYLALLNDRLALLGDRHFDLTDAGLLDSEDCEFVDGIHGGEVTYARIASHLSRGHPGLADEKEIAHAVNRRRGYASVPTTSIPTYIEVDSLALGCARAGAGQPGASRGGKAIAS